MPQKIVTSNEDLASGGWTYRATLVRAVDGDTIDVTVDLGFRLRIELRLRLVGVDTPERGHPDYARATAMLREHLDGKPLMLRTHKDRTGKYGRYLATVYIVGEDESVNAKMARAGWPYVPR